MGSMSGVSGRMDAVTITAAADGSALGNPGPSGWAWYIDDQQWHAGGWPHGTNNQGELMAVLDLFRSTSHVPEEELRILCDSQYVINSVTKWMPGWKCKGWRKSDGKPVLNVELLQDIDRELKGRKYTFEWVKGHAGHPLNEAADERARAAATAFQQGVAPRSGPGFGGAAEARGVSLEEAAYASASEHTAGVPASAPTPRADKTRAAALHEAPDLFSELEEDPFAAAPGTMPSAVSAESIVEALERELLEPAVRADLGRTGQLLHPDFIEIGQSGRLWTRDATMTSLAEDGQERVDLELIAADRVSSGSVLLTYRSHTREGTVLRSSLWVLDGAAWRLRFHQGTAEP